MQLKNHLYTIVEADKQGNLQQKDAAGLQQKEAAGLQQKCQEVLSNRSNTSFRLRLNPEHFIYQAHFPGEPVTPGNRAKRCKPFRRSKTKAFHCQSPCLKA